MAKCIRCERRISDAPVRGTEHVSEPCPRAPDRGSHEIGLHEFVGGRLDGLCAHVDPDFPGTSCGYERVEDERFVDRLHHFLPPLRLSPRTVIAAAIRNRYPDLDDADFPENFGAIVEEALARHDYAIVSTASELRK